MKIKAKYIGQIELNFCHDEDEEGILSFDEIKENMRHLNSNLQRFLNRELSQNGEDRVTVTQIACDVWRED